MSNLYELDAATLRQLVQSGEVSAREVAEAHLARIEVVNPLLNAMPLVDAERALRDAELIDAGTVTGSLSGVPFTSKINTDHRGYPTDNGVVAFAGVTAEGTVPSIKGLEAAGGIMMGRTNSPAMALRVHTGNRLHGETLNPLNPSVTAGGSSGGAAVAVATGMCVIAQGNDVGGSVRWPAMCLGITGLRPTMGRMNTMSTNPTAVRPYMARLMATQGPLARTVADLETAFIAMAAAHDTDPGYRPVPLSQGPFARRCVVVTDDGREMSDVTLRALRKVGQHLSDAGWLVEEGAPPRLADLFGLWDSLSAPDILAGLSPAMLHLIDDPDLTSWISDWAERQVRVDLDTYVTALSNRDAIGRAWQQFFADIPLVVTASLTVPSLPVRVDAIGHDSVTQMLDAMRYQFAFPTIGVPVLQVPVDGGGDLPHGVQLVSGMYREDILLRAARDIEEREGQRPVVTPVGNL